MPWLFAILAAGWLAFFLVQPFDGTVSDFPQYYAPARLIVSGHGAQTYEVEKVTALQHEVFPSMGERVLPTYLPPPSLFWFLPFGFLPGAIGDILWKVTQGACLAASVLLLKSAFKLNRKASLWLVAVLCASGPAFAATRIEQVSMLLLCALSAAIWAFKNDKPWLAATALSLLMLKPQEGLPLFIFLLGARRYKVLLLTSGILACTTLVVCLLIGPHAISDYFLYASSAVEKSGLMQSELGPTLRGQLLRFAPDSKTPIAVISGAAALLALAFIFVSGRRFATHPAWLEAGLLIAMPLGLVTCFHLHSYDLTLLVPSVVILLAGPLENAAPPILLLLGFLLLGTFMVPFYIYIHWDYLLKEHWLINPHFFVLLILAIGLAYLAYRYPDKIREPISEISN